MAESGLPCFGRGAPIENLRKRFHLEMSERQAAQFMRQTILDAYQKWTTGVYDALQNIQVISDVVGTPRLLTRKNVACIMSEAI
jgi:phosphatidylinositol kinase/protein kinase (PI-3  family)